MQGICINCKSNQVCDGAKRNLEMLECNQFVQKEHQSYKSAKTVAELIEILKKYPSETEVHGEGGGEIYVEESDAYPGTLFIG